MTSNTDPNAGRTCPDTPARAFLRELAPLRILVVDDDPMTQDVLCGHYRDLGFVVDAVENGRAALTALEVGSRQPDIILCDRRMPDISGIELLERIRGGQPEWAKIVFIFVTALKDSRDRHATADLHPDAYLTKPIDFTVADHTLAVVLGKRLRPGSGTR